MKSIIKRALLGMCMAACLFSLSACSRAETVPSKVADKTQLQLKGDALSYLVRYLKVTDQQVDAARSKFAREDEALADGLDSWENIKHDLGEFVGVYEDSRVTELKHGYSTVLSVQFEKRRMDFTVTTDEDAVVTSVTFAPQYTMAENMEKAFFNMVLGMGTVFFVLILISFLISRFKYIGRFEEAMKNRKKKGTRSVTGTIETPAAVSMKESVTDGGTGRPEKMAGGLENDLKRDASDLASDYRLVAIITAAIAAAEGTNPSGLVVRSIRRSPAGKWKKA